MVGVQTENHSPSKDWNRSRLTKEIGLRCFPRPPSRNNRPRLAASVLPKKKSRWICSDDKYLAVASTASSCRSLFVSRTARPRPGSVSTFSGALLDCSTPVLLPGLEPFIHHGTDPGSAFLCSFSQSASRPLSQVG